MKHFKRLGLAGAVVLMVCGSAGSASAISITPLNTHVTFTSTNSLLTVHGGGTVSCADSVITGRTPVATGITTVPFTLHYTGCLASGILPATVTTSEGCQTPASTPTLHITTVTPAITGDVSLRAGCHYTIEVPAIECTLTVGPQTIGPFTFTNHTASTPSTIHLAGGKIGDIIVNNPTANGACPATGTRTGTFTGLYTSASKVTVEE